MNETPMQTALKLRPIAEQFINDCYGDDSEQASDFYWTWNYTDDWRKRAALCVDWLRIRTQAQNNGVLRNGHE